MKKRIAIWNFNYMPEWEAASKEVADLLDGLDGEFEAHLLAMNTKNRRLGLSGPRKQLPLPWALCLLPFLKKYASRFDVNHIYASLSESLLQPRLTGPSTLLTASKDNPSLARIEKNLPHLKAMALIVVESELHRKLLLQSGLDRGRVRLIYPGREVRDYRVAEDPFKILFATSPNAKHDMLARGINLMLNVAGRLPDVRFILAWRERNLADLETLIGEFDLKNIEVRNGHIPDMNRLYDSVHATILPGLTHNSIKPCPHSALDSLAHGKPVLVSNPLTIASLVREYRCGIVFEPLLDGLEAAIRELRDHYETYLPPCRWIIRETFSPMVFLDRYREIYEALGEG